MHLHQTWFKIEVRPSSFCPTKMGDMYDRSTYQAWDATRLKEQIDSTKKPPNKGQIKS